jgi:hypothetical protein
MTTPRSFFSPAHSRGKPFWVLEEIHFKEEKMKKSILFAVALIVAFAIVAPAMALELAHDGYLRTRYFLVDSWTLTKNQGGDNNEVSDSYWDMKFRLNTVFTVNDNVLVTTRIEGLNGPMGGGADTDDEISLERAWITIKGDWGMIRSGRMGGGVFGNVFKDTDTERYRVRYDIAAGGFKGGIIYETNAELDIGTVTSSGDSMAYYGYFAFGGETFNTGLLYGYLDNKTQRSVFGATNTLTEYKELRHLFVPFFNGTFGPFSVQAEIDYQTGERDFYAVGVPDPDIQRLSWNLEGVFNFGAGSVELGYGYTSGQEFGINPDVTGDNFGDDWEKTFVLVGSTGNVDLLGGQGNWSASGGNTSGLGLLFLGADFNLGETMTLGGIIAYGKADEVDENPATNPNFAIVDDDVGYELDVKWTWSMYEAAKLTAIGFYYKAGDYWEQYVGANQVEDLMGLFVNLQVTF